MFPSVSPDLPIESSKKPDIFNIFPFSHVFFYFSLETPEIFPFFHVFGPIFPCRTSGGGGDLGLHGVRADAGGPGPGPRWGPGGMWIWMVDFHIG